MKIVKFSPLSMLKPLLNLKSHVLAHLKIFHNLGDEMRHCLYTHSTCSGLQEYSKHCFEFCTENCEIFSFVNA